MADPQMIAKLTGDLKRKPVEWKLEQLLERIKAHGPGVVSVAYLDIDHFTQIEAEYGDDVADALLAEIDSWIASLKKREEVELVGWYVRDSCVIIYNLDLDAAHITTEAIRDELSQKTFQVQTGQGRFSIPVSFSAGVASYPNGPEDKTELIDLAEDAARRAYASGGGCTYYGRPMKMMPKTNLYLPTQLERLKQLSSQLKRNEASLLREALSDLLRKYDQRDFRRKLRDQPVMSAASEDGNERRAS